MASCTFEKQGNSYVVRTRNGNRSILFDSIAGIPVVNNIDQAVKSYSSVLSNKFKSVFGDWESKISVNPTAVQTIQTQLSSNGVENIEAVIDATRTMENPMLLTYSDISQEYAIEGKTYYTTDLKSDSPIFLVDVNNTEDIQISEIPEGADPISTQTEALLASSASVINFTSLNGNEYKVIQSGKEIVDINNLHNTFNVNGITYNNGEPKLFFMTPQGTIHYSYGDALRNTSSGNIEAGFLSGTIEKTSSSTVVTNADIVIRGDEYILNNPSSFLSIMNINSNSNPSTLEGYVNYMIKAGILSGEKVRYGNEYFYMGEGNLPGRKMFNSNVASSDAKITKLADFNTTLYEDGRIRIEPNSSNTVTLVAVNGRTTSMNRSEIKSMLRDGRYNELASKYSNMPYLAGSIFMEDNDIYRTNNTQIIEDAKKEDFRLRSSILNILKSLGISVVGMDEYLRKYGLRKGGEPTARALSDLGNSVIALAENATEADLTEEAAHFLIDTYHDQESIRSILPEVESTTEWADYADNYYTIYSKMTKPNGDNYSGQELTDLVRKEVLGKVLRNEFQRRFDRINDNSFVRSVYDTFVNIINSIRNFYSNQRTQLDNIISEIADTALSDDLTAFDTSLLDGSTFVLYSADAKRTNDFFAKQRRDLELQLRNLKKASSPYASRLKIDVDRINREVGRLGDALNRNVIESTIHSIVSTTEAQANFLDNMIKIAQRSRSNDEKLTFSVQDWINLNSVNTVMLPLTRDLRGFITEELDLDKNFKKNILNKIDKTIIQVEALNATVQNIQRRDNEKLITKIISTFGNIAGKDLQYVLDTINNTIKDISWYSSKFGTLEHSRIPQLGILRTFISRVYYGASTDSQNQTKSFLSEVERKNMKISDFQKILQKDRNGRYSSFLLNEYDMPRVEEDYKRAQIQSLIDTYPDLQGISVDELYEQSEKGGFKFNTGESEVKFKADMYNARFNFMTASDWDTYSKSFNKFLETNSEQRFLPQYREQTENIYKSAENLRPEGSLNTGPISDEARSYLRDINRQRYEVKKPFMDSKGIVDWVALRRDKNAVYSLNEINRQKQVLKSRLTLEGTMKTGRDLVIADDIAAIDEAWKKHFEGREQTVSQEFFNELERVNEESGSSDAYEFLMANANISFTNEFFDDMGEGYEAIGSRIANDDRNGLEEDEREALNEAVDNIKEARERLRSVIARNRDTLNLGEIDYSGMSPDDVRLVKEYTTEIQNNQDVIRNAQRAVGEEQEFADDREYEVNESYFNALKDSGYSIQNEYKFAMEHATDKNAARISNFRHKLSTYTETVLPNFTAEQRVFIARWLGYDETISRDDLKDLMADRFGNDPIALIHLLNAYSRSKTLSYFRRFAPKGYSSLVNRVKSGEVDVVKFARNIVNRDTEHPIYKYMQLSVTDQWQEEGREFEKYLNPNYVEDSEIGHFQPKKSIYRNEEYFNHFGIDVNGNPTQNVEEFKFIRQLVDLKRQALENYSERSQSHNLFIIPQISKTTIEKATSNIPLGETITNYVKDLTMNRVDDPLYGQTEDLGIEVANDQALVIPKYYLNRLEEQSDVSNDLARSYAMLLTQSNIYKHRMNSIDVIMGLEQSLLNSKYEGGKSPESTNVYQTFKEHMNAFWYGKRVNSKLEIPWFGGGKLDVTKLGIAYDKFVRLMNLGFSPIIAATAFTTGQLNLILEASVGQYVNHDSLSYANREVSKLLSGYLSEVGDIDRNNRLYVIGERLGIFRLGERVHSAGYNKAIRLMGRDVPYRLMEFLNFPLAPQVMISVLDDTRYYEGRFYRYNQFSKLFEGQTKEQIKSRWNNLREDSLYNILNVSDGQISFREGIDPSLIEEQLKMARGEINSLNQVSDAVVSPEDKSSAARNVLFNFVLAHRGWFQLNIQRRYKKKGYNFQTSQMEESPYRTVFNFLTNTKKALLSEQGMGNIFSALQETYHQLDDNEKRNMTRVVVDLGAFAIGVALMPILAGIGDDDDNKDNWLAQFGVYVGLRTINEMYAQLPVMIEKEAIDMMQSPFVAARKLGELTTLSNYNFWGEVESGPYQGETRLWSLLMKQTWGKLYYQMKTPEDLKRTSDYFRIMNSETLFLGQKRKE